VAAKKLRAGTGSAASNIARLLAALRHEKADRVPNFEILIDNRSLRHILGLPPKGQRRITLWSVEPEEAVRAALAVGQDAVACSMTWTLPRNGCILSHQDAERILRPPDPCEARAKLQRYLGATAGTNVGVCARLSAPMTLTYMALGPAAIESFMYLLHDQPDLVERVMDIFLDYHLRLLETIADLPYHFYYIGDDISSSTGPLISPALLKRLWAPRAERLIRAALATGRPVIFHCCGTLAPILPYLLKWGVQAVHPIQPIANDIYAIRARYGERLTLVGNIDVDSVLSRGTPEAVRADVREHIERLAGGGSYVVCSSHSIIDSIPPENYLAMVRAAREFGSYRRRGVP
jgi:uroporphyrinogen decarboxylase